MLTLTNILPYIVKTLQIGCDVVDLGSGIFECVETLPGERKPIEKIISGATRLIFSSLEVGMRLNHASDKTFSILKEVELISLGTIVLPIEMYGVLNDYVNGKISGIRALEKGTGSMASVLRAGLECAIHTEKYYLGLTEEERANEYRWVLKPGSDPECPEYEKKPIVVEECERNLKSAEKGILPVGIAEISLRMGLLSLTVDKAALAYQIFTQRYRRPRNLPQIGQLAPLPQNNVLPNNPLPPQDPFRLCDFDVIPEELEKDILFKRFICPLSRLPVRDPVGDPTLVNDKGEIIPSVFERKILVKWVHEHRKSPTTGKVLLVHQLIQKPHLKILIDQRLEFYSERLRKSAKQQVRKNIQPPQNLLQNAENEIQGF